MPIHVPFDEIKITEVICPRCSANERIRLFSARDRLTDYPGVFGVVRCKRCMLIYLSPRPALDSIKYFYPRFYYSAMECLPGMTAPTLRDAIRAARLHMILDYPHSVILESYPLLRRVCNPHLKRLWKLSYSIRPNGIEFIPKYVQHGKILCVGFGRIAELEILRELGWEVWGIDIDEELVRQARGKGFSVRVAASISDARFLVKSFDVVLMSHVLEHMPNPFAELAEAKRVLKSKGILQIIVPRNDSIYASLFGKYWIGWDLPRHLTDFGTNQLKDSIVKEGFSIVSSSYYSTRYTPVYGFMYMIFERFHAYHKIPAFFNKVFFFPGILLYALAVLSQRGDNLCVMARK